MEYDTSRSTIETWHCAPNLRFKCGILQQAWISDRGNIEWRDVQELEETTATEIPEGNRVK